jgi:hypothetical protein
LSLLQNSNAISTGGGYNLESSLRFRSSANAYLEWTPTSVGNRKKFTISMWAKRGKLGTAQYLFSAYNANNNNGLFQLLWSSSDSLYWGVWTTGSTSPAKFRDPSAWYHIVVKIDTTLVGSSQVRTYVNNVDVTEPAFAGITQNTDLAINNTITHYIGRNGASAADYQDGYITEVNFVDGQALTPSDFGEYDDTTGVWKPKRYAGSYGTNGFYLDCNTKDNINITNSVVSGGNNGNDSISCNVGDLILVLGGDADTSPGTQSASGVVLTEVASTANSESSSRLYYGYATSTTVSTSSSNTLDGNIIIAIEGGQFSSYAVADDTSGDAIPPTLSANIESDDYIFVLGAFDRRVTVNSTSSGYTLIGNNDNDIAMAAVYKTGINATSETPGTWSNTSDGWAVYTIHVKRMPIVGADTSGNNNNWTTNNINYTAPFETTYDIMNDVPTLTDEDTANFATLNPVSPLTTSTLQDANLQMNSTSASWKHSYSTIALPNTGKWYFEMSQSSDNNNCHMGIAPVESLANGSNGYVTDAILTNTPNADGVAAGGLAGSTGTWTGTYNINAGDALACAVDMDANKVWFRIGSNWIQSGDPSTGTNPAVSGGINTSKTYHFIASAYAESVYANFGQRPFQYTVPTGFKKLNTYNLPDSTIVDGSQYMNIVTYTGNGGYQFINPGFTPDLIWIKSRSGGSSHIVGDRIRGIRTYLSTNGTTGAITNSGVLPTIGTFGFATGNSFLTNESGESYVAWVWSADGTSGSSNTNGTITSTVSANPTSGFSIATFTGNGLTAQTIGHGLSQPTELYIWKRLDAAENWGVETYGIDGTADFLTLNTTSAKADSGTAGEYLSTSTTQYISFTGAGLNANGGNYIVYSFHSVEGYSKIGSYTGNGSADGPFVYTGFDVKFLLYKNADAVNSWVLYDNVRDPNGNPQSYYLIPNSSGVEGTTPDAIDFLSNGFKIRYANASVNTSGQTHIYMAFAENPFKHSLAR